VLLSISYEKNDFDRFADGSQHNFELLRVEQVRDHDHDYHARASSSTVAAKADRDDARRHVKRYQIDAEKPRSENKNQDQNERRNRMKRALTLVIAALFCATVARAGDVKVKAFMTTGPEDEAVTSFMSDTPKLYAMFKTKGIQNGDKVRGVLVAENVGDVAPANSQVLEKTLTLEEDTSDGDFNFSKPTNGWPAGKYRVEIYVNGELATTVKFTIKSAAKSKKSDEDESSGD
jgi:hypothetical protein